MYRDTQKALKRLEAALLAEEEEERREKAEEQTPEASGKAFDYEAETVAANISAEKIRNYANQYNAYNTDRVDEELEEFSEDIYNGGRKSRTGVLIFVMILLTGITCGLLWWLAREWGIWQ